MGKCRVEFGVFGGEQHAMEGMIDEESSSGEWCVG